MLGLPKPMKIILYCTYTWMRLPVSLFLIEVPQLQTFNLIKWYLSTITYLHLICQTLRLSWVVASLMREPQPQVVLRPIIMKVWKVPPPWKAKCHFKGRRNKVWMYKDRSKLKKDSQISKSKSWIHQKSQLNIILCQAHQTIRFSSKNNSQVAFKATLFNNKFQSKFNNSKYPRSNWSLMSNWSSSQ